MVFHVREGILAGGQGQARAWLAEVENRIKAIRARVNGEAENLTPRDAHALAGEWYQWFLAPYENAPGKAETWARAFDAFMDAIRDEWAPERHEAGDDLGKLLANDAIRADIRPIVADQGKTSQFLATRGLVLTPQARNLFLDCVIESYIEALDVLKRRAKGDYSPDDRPRTFPEFRPPKVRGKGLDPWSLFEQWVKEVQPAQSTVARWRTVFLEMRERFKNADDITEDDAREWARGLNSKTRSAFTVSAVTVTASRTIFAWAKGQKLVASNPFAEIKITVPQKTQNRESKAFTPQEAQTILSAALAIEGKAMSKAAQRWVPWLCAYSGARAGEIAQLRGQDIEQRGEQWVARITPEAGTVKTRKARAVPLHEHVIDQGFIEFVKWRGKGPLFYNVDNGERVNSSPTVNDDAGLIEAI